MRKLNTAAALAAGLAWSVTTSAIPLATTEVSKFCEVRAGGSDVVDQAGFVPQFFEQAASCTLTVTGTGAVGDAFAGFGSVGSRIGITRASADIQSSDGIAEANLVASAHYQFEIKPINGGPGNPPSLLPVLFDARGVGSTGRVGYGISRSQGVAHLFGDPLPSGAGLLGFDVSVVDEIAFDPVDQESLGGGFNQTLEVDLFANHTYNVVLSAACSTWVAPVGGQSAGASARCSALVDPVLGFDQAAFDQRMGANSFPLAQDYAFVFSENVTTPIPEPGTWAMMLAGLSLIGWLARRRIA